MTPEALELVNDSHAFRELQGSPVWDILCKHIQRHSDAALARLCDTGTTDSQVRYWQGVVFALNQITKIPQLTIAEAERLSDLEKVRANRR